MQQCSSCFNRSIRTPPPNRLQQLPNRTRPHERTSTNQPGHVRSMHEGIASTAWELSYSGPPLPYLLAFAHPSLFFPHFPFDHSGSGIVLLHHMQLAILFFLSTQTMHAFSLPVPTPMHILSLGSEANHMGIKLQCSCGCISLAIAKIYACVCLILYIPLKVRHLTSLYLSSNNYTHT